MEIRITLEAALTEAEFDALKRLAKRAGVATEAFAGQALKALLKRQIESEGSATPVVVEKTPSRKTTVATLPTPSAKITPFEEAFPPVLQTLKPLIARLKDLP